MGFSCPVEQSKGPGKPRFYIPEEVIRGLRDVHGVWKKVAKEVLVSYKTILRRRHQYSMAVSNTTGPRIFQMRDFVVLGPSRKGRSLQVMLESTKKNGGSRAFFRDIISPNLAQKRLFLEGTVLNWMQSQHEVLKCNLFTYRFTVNFTVGYLGLSPGSGSLWKNLNLSYQTAFGQETLYFRLTTPRHCLRTRLTGSTIKIASRIRHLWTRFPLLRNDPIMYVSPEFGMTWTTLPTFSHRIWNIKWFLYQLC